jgi:hypothetical protein
MDDKTSNYVRQIVWNTVEYRWEKYFSCIFLINSTENSVGTETVFSSNLDSVSPFHILFNYQRRGLQATNTNNFFLISMLTMSATSQPVMWVIM